MEKNGPQSYALCQTIIMQSHFSGGMARSSSSGAQIQNETCAYFKNTNNCPDVNIESPPPQPHQFQSQALNLRSLPGGGLQRLAYRSGSSR